MEDQEDKEDGEVNYAEMNAESNHGESSEDHNTSFKNNEQPHSTEQADGEHLANELNNEDDKEATSNDHDRPSSNDLDDRKDHLPANHLESNSSLFTFENVVSNVGQKRRLRPNLIPNTNQQPKLTSNNSFVSVSGFKDRFSSDFKSKFKETMSLKNGGGFATTEPSFINRSKFDGNDEQYSQEDTLRDANSQTSTTASYSNDWSGSLSSSTIFTPIRALKRQHNSTTSTASPNGYHSTVNKRKQQTTVPPTGFGYKIPHRTADETNNQLITTSNSAEQQQVDQSIDRLSSEETNSRNQTISTNDKHRPAGDRPISELLSEKVNFNYHPILDFMNRKER